MRLATAMCSRLLGRYIFHIRRVSCFRIRIWPPLSPSPAEVRWIPICGFGPSLANAQLTAWRPDRATTWCLHVERFTLMFLPFPTILRAIERSEEHTSELQSRQYLHPFPTRRSSDLFLVSESESGHRFPRHRRRFAGSLFVALGHHSQTLS